MLISQPVVAAHRSGTSISFIHLPPEILIAICAFVDCRSLVHSRAVCRLLRDAIDRSLELQYRIELVRDGMTDNGTSPSSSPSHSPLPYQINTTLLTTSDRLARLRQLRKAWKTLSWTQCVTVPMPGPCCAYELVGGIFCKTQPKVRGGGRAAAGIGAGFEWNGGWPIILGENGHGGGANGGGEGEDVHQVPHDFGLRTMFATWLPGRHDPGHTVVKDDLGIPTRDFALDPSQDLLVLFKGDVENIPLDGVVVVFRDTLELHIRTLSTNQAHPGARVPVLSTLVTYPITSMFVQIVDDVVGMMYCVNPALPCIMIWNWKTGNLVVDSRDGNLPPGTWDFSFINSRALFVTTGNDGGSLELFTFTCDRADANADTGSDANSPPYTGTGTSPLNHIATLYLPPIHSSVRVLSVCSHTGPFLAGCPPDKPFVASNEERIHVLTIQYVHTPTLDGTRARPRVAVFVHNRALEGYLERGASRAVMGTGKKATVMGVPWTEWGRIYARMLPHVGIFQWLRYVHGQRVVMLLPTSQAGKSTLQVLDFSFRSAYDDDDDDDDDADYADQGTCKEENAKGDDNESTLEYVTYPTEIVMPNIFVNVVESGLPYRDVRRDVKADYSGMMIDDERLIGLKNPAFLTGNMKEIDVFTM